MTQEIAVGSGGELRLFSETGELRQRLDDFEHRIHRLQYSPDESCLAIASGDSIFLWDRSAGAIRSELRGHGNTVQKLAYSADGEMLASISHDQSVRLWNVRNRESEQVLLGHKARPTALCWSKDGLRVATGDAEGAVIIWDTTTAQEILRIDDVFPHQILAIQFRGKTELVALTSNPQDGTFLCTWSSKE